MSIRSDILVDVLETLQTIKASAESLFQSNVEKVVMRDVSPDDFQGNDVFCGVFVQAYQSGPTLTRGTGKVLDLQKAMQIAIRAIIRTTDVNAENDKSALISDMENALFEDRRRGNTKDPVDTTSMVVTQEYAGGFGGSGVVATFLAVLTVTWQETPAAL